MNLQQIFLTTSIPLVSLVSLVEFPASTFAQAPAVAPDSVSTTLFCKIVDGIPNTVARITSQNVSSAMSAGVPSKKATVSEELIPVFQWGRKYYSESKESPTERCTRVSTLLQTYKREGKLNYISSGMMDGKKVICTTNSTVGTCSRLLFVLESEEESEEETQKLLKDLRQVIGNPTLVSAKQATTGSFGGGIYSRWIKGIGRSSIRSMGTLVR
jgi:hypothetical protein